MWVSPVVSLQVLSTFPDQFHAHGDLSLEAVEVIRARKWRWHWKKERERGDGMQWIAMWSSTKVTTFPSFGSCDMVMDCNYWGGILLDCI